MEVFAPIAVCCSLLCFSLFFPRMKSCNVTRRYGDCEDGFRASSVAVAVAAAAAADGAGTGLENVAVVAVVDVDEDDFADFLSYLFKTNMFLGMLDEKKRSVGR